MTPTRFEDRLLAELRQIVAARPIPPAPAANAQAAASARRRAPRRLLAVAATAGVAATAILLVAGGDRVTPAFAVERQPDGNVSVTINRISDAADLQRQLQAAGIPAVVDYTPAGKTCRQPRGRPAPAPSRPAEARVAGSTAKGGSTRFTISRNMVSSGQTLVIATSGGDGPTSVGMEVVQGPVAACQLVNAPAPPADAAGAFSTHGSAKGTSTGTETRSLHTGP
jgi:hypothetical protein